MMQEFVIRGKYETSTGQEKINLHKKLEANVLTTIRAKLFEGCVEASFQVNFAMNLKNIKIFYSSKL